MKRTIIFFTLLFFISSCVVTNISLNPQGNYTPLIQKENVSNELRPIYLHFQTEPIPFEYSKIGILEYVGNFDDTLVLENFKYQAWKNGGNAVLSITKQSVESGQKSYTDTYGNTHTRLIYTTKWTGIISEIPSNVYENKKNELSSKNYIELVEKNDAHTVKMAAPGLQTCSSILVLSLLGIVYYYVEAE